MKVAFKDGIKVDVRRVDGGWRDRAGTIVRYDQEGFYIVYVDDRRLVVHENDMRLPMQGEARP